MRILHISPMYFPALGGSELHLKELSEGLVSRGHDVTVLTANVRSHCDLWPGRCGGLPEIEEINGVKLVRLNPDGGLLAKALDMSQRLRGGYRSLSLLFSPEGLGMLLQGPRMFATIPRVLCFPADIVTSMNWYWPAAYHTYLARRLKRFTLVGIPLFHTVQAWSKRTIYKRMLASCDAVIVNTAHEGQFVQERGATRVEVAGVGIHPEAFVNRNGGDIRAQYSLGNAPVVGFVGRQDAKKGATKLVEAMKTVWKINHDVRLVLAGPRSYTPNEIDAIIDGCDPFERDRIVRIHDFTEADKASIYDAFDIFALPSTEESFGIAYVEAWACAKPVIGAYIGSTRCVIDGGVDGLLVNPNDSNDIARAIIKLLSDANMRESMGRNGFAKITAQFTWDKVTDKVEKLYTELAAAKAPHNPLPK